MCLAAILNLLDMGASKVSTPPTGSLSGGESLGVSPPTGVDGTGSGLTLHTGVTEPLVPNSGG